MREKRCVKKEEKSSSMTMPLEMFPGLRVGRDAYRVIMSESESPLMIVTCECGPGAAIFSDFSREDRNPNLYAMCLIFNFSYFKTFKETSHRQNIKYLWRSGHPGLPVHSVCDISRVELNVTLRRMHGRLS